jgi:hypothetical protein
LSITYDVIACHVSTKMAIAEAVNPMLKKTMHFVKVIVYGCQPCIGLAYKQSSRKATIET